MDQQKDLKIGETGTRENSAYELSEGGEGDEVVVWVWLYEQLGRRAEADSGGEVSNGEGQHPAAVYVVGFAVEPHPRVRPPLAPTPSPPLLPPSLPSLSLAFFSLPQMR